jgi:putative FmdB family regulatory protein
LPIYDYECVKCAHRFEMTRKYSDTAAVPCPLCGGKTKRVYSSVPVHFKGSGFYVNDYPKTGSSAPAGGTETVKHSTEAKVTTKGK